MLVEAIEKVTRGYPLSKEEMQAALSEMLDNQNPYQSGAFLALMRSKGETIEELLAVVEQLRSEMIPFKTSFPVLDLVGTGGDKAQTVNISTASAILAASLGVKVAKHGNRSVSSRCGSADLLEELGICIELSTQRALECLETIGMTFLFAPLYHPTLKKIATVRRGLKIPTFFNQIGPLLNPASAQYQMIGVSSTEMLHVLPSLLQKLGTHHSFVFHGQGLDELSCLGPAEVYEVSADDITRFYFDPTAYGLKLCHLKELQGGDPSLNAKLLLDALGGKPGAIGDTLALNSGIALYLYGLAETIEEGICLGQRALREKKAIELIEKWRILCPIS